MNIYLALFLTFARIGGLTFGGGYAMLPMLTREVVNKRKWATEEELMDIYAVGQCTPGVIAVNTATFIGAKQKGALGGIMATLGIITPSLIIIMLVAGLIGQFAHIELVQHAFAGVRIAVCGMVSVTVYKLARKSVVDVPTFIFLLVTFAAVAFLGFSPVLMVVLAAVAGVITQAVRLRKNRKESSK